MGNAQFHFSIKIKWGDEILPKEFDALLEFAGKLLDSLDGVKPADPRLVESWDLCLKIILHASTIRHLYAVPTVIGFGDNKVNIYNFASSLVLARTLFETYLVFHDVFIAPETEDDREFEYCRWKIRGFKVQQDYKPFDELGKQRLCEALEKLEPLTKRITKTKRYRLLDGEGKQAILKGNGNLKFQRAMLKAGFSEETFSRFYAMGSSYIHSDGQTATQLRSASSISDQKQLFGMTFLMVQTVISKLILVLSKTFSELQEVCKLYPRELFMAEIYSSAASSIDDPEKRKAAMEHHPRSVPSPSK